MSVSYFNAMARLCMSRRIPLGDPFAIPLAVAEHRAAIGGIEQSMQVDRSPGRDLVENDAHRVRRLFDR